MRELRNKGMYSLPVIILLSIAAFTLTKGAIKILVKEKESRQKVEALRQEISAMTVREELLKKKIERLGTPEGLEEEIKEKFSVVREGEHAAIIVDEKRSATSTDVLKMPWYKKLFIRIIR
ncbi:MAG: septum formation initiator family protein [Candidatus Zambryskibacteria bacterium]|nr:septum formation initiator family protein [Candidatus Zambryskibacteria bacterium]